MVELAPEMVVRVSGAMRKAASDAVHGSEYPFNWDVQTDKHQGAREMQDEAVKLVEALPAASMIDYPDREVVALLSLNAEDVAIANTPIPFERVEPAEEEDPNALNLEDPDAENQDYGLGPVRGE
jgi:hypothetical protein